MDFMRPLLPFEHASAVLRLELRRSVVNVQRMIPGLCKQPLQGSRSIRKGLDPDLPIPDHAFAETIELRDFIRFVDECDTVIALDIERLNELDQHVVLEFGHDARAMGIEEDAGLVALPAFGRNLTQKVFSLRA
jgi:hypothetical protein